MGVINSFSQYFSQVKEEYLRNFLRLKVASQLQELSLNKCSITENLFDFDEGKSSSVT